MRGAVLLALAMVAVTGVAAALRLADLDNRPMHCDEANQAVKFGRLLEQGDYVYDPREHHGPSLNLLTLPVAWLASARKLTEITEIHLRLVPALFGIVLVGLAWLLRRELGDAAALCAAVLTAVSAAMVFYSRYYIHEMLLATFTFGAMVALWRYAREVGATAAQQRDANRRSRVRRAFWLVLLGLCVGMMHASKETCVIPLFAIAVAAASTMRQLRSIGPKRLALAGLVVLLVAAGISALLFSSFLSNPQGVVDSYAAYSGYLGRASGAGSEGPQAHPWYHYLQVLFWWRRPGGPLWTEVPIGVLALVGLTCAALGKGLKPASLPIVRFLSIYTVLMMGIYSVIPYKTPWCVVGFLHGMVLLAGVGAAVLVRAAPGYILKATTVAVLIAATGHLACQAYRAGFVAYGDPNNPYVHTPTARDVPRLARRVGQIAALRPDGQLMHVQVICPDHDYWPLPWYLRDVSRVGWFSQVPDYPPAPLIIMQPPLKTPVPEHFYAGQPPGQRSAYIPVVPEEEGRKWHLRRHVPLLAYVRADLWEEFTACQAPNGLRLEADSTGDLVRLAGLVEQIAAVHPDGKAVHIEVICPGHDYWPLPWCLYAFSGIEWSAEVPGGPAAPLIITQPPMEDALSKRLYLDAPPGQRYLYVPLLPEGEDRDWQLRPNVPLRVYARLDLWEAYQANR